MVEEVWVRYILRRNSGISKYVHRTRMSEGRKYGLLTKDSTGCFSNNDIFTQDKNSKLGVSIRGGGSFTDTTDVRMRFDI